MILMLSILDYKLKNYYCVIISVDTVHSEVRFLEAIEIARKVVEAASDKQAADITLLDAREVCGFADYFVICNGDSQRQIQAIYDEIRHVLKKEGILAQHYEGTVESGWLLVDFGNVIAHIFAPLEREFYQLDKLWRRATAIIRIQ